MSTTSSPNNRGRMRRRHRKGRGRKKRMGIVWKTNISIKRRKKWTIKLFIVSAEGCWQPGQVLAPCSEQKWDLCDIPAIIHPLTSSSIHGNYICSSCSNKVSVIAFGFEVTQASSVGSSQASPVQGFFLMLCWWEHSFLDQGVICYKCWNINFKLEIGKHQ